MPNTAFRIAFWALFISLWLCVTAAVISPQPQMALRDLKSQESELRIQLGTPRPFPADQRLASSNVELRMPVAPQLPTGPRPLNDIPSLPIPSLPLVERHVPDPYLRSMPASLAPPVDEGPAETIVQEPNVIIPPPWKNAVVDAPASADPVGDSAPLVEPQPYAPRPRMARTVTQPEDVSASHDLATSELTATPVVRGVFEELPPPDPSLYQPAPTTETPVAAPALVAPPTVVVQPVIDTTATKDLAQAVRDLRDELTRLHITQLQRDVEEAREALAKDLVSVPATAPVERTDELSANTVSVETAAVEAAAPAETSRSAEPTVSNVSIETPVAQGAHAADSSASIRVTAGDTEGTWSFEFNDVPLSKVLQTLADSAGQEVVIEPGLEGTLTQNFRNVDPAKAFATVIKLHGLGIDFRGQTLLVRRSAVSRLRESN